MTSQTSSFDIAIHGAGFVGRTLALLLAQQGMRVALIADETSAARAAPDIRAFALSLASKEVLERVQAWPALDAITPVYSMQVFGDSGGELVFDRPQAGADQPLNWIVDVSLLEQALKERVAREPTMVSLAGDAVVQATLHVVCEGRASAAIQKLSLIREVISYPQHAVAARLTCELPHANVARQWFNERGEVLALLPMQGGAGHEVALVWSLESNRAKEMLVASDADFTAALQACLDGALGAMQLSSPRAAWPLTLTRSQTWANASPDGGVWVLAGDAAHTVHPLAGQGLNLGLGDAAHLAKTLQAVQAGSPLFKPTQTQLLRALRSYARARQAAAAETGFLTDGLHLLFARDGLFVTRARNLGMLWLNRATHIKRLLIKKAQSAV